MSELKPSEPIPTGLITVVAVMKAKSGKEDQLRAAALALVQPTRQEEGCVQYDLHVHLADPAWLVFYENWTSVEHLERHGTSPHLTAFRAIAADLLETSRVERYSRIA
jgi:quinol monooxygenase YgiN